MQGLAKEAAGAGQPVTAGRGLVFGIAVTGVACALFALPLGLLTYYRADYLTFANESLAYRYFACERIQHGERGTVWLPQGQLLGVVQHGVLFAVRHLTPWAGNDLRHLSNAFAAGTSLANVLAMWAVFLSVGRARTFSWSDKLLVFVVGLAPIYGTGSAGAYYGVLPDYYHTDVVLVTLAAAVFIWQLRAGPAARPMLRAALLGALAGLFVANKITLAVAGGMVVFPALCAGGPGPRAWACRLLAAAASALGSFLLVLLAFYLFHPAAVAEMFPRWAGFAHSAGAEPSFWRLGFWHYARQCGYGWVIAFWLVASLAALALVRRPVGPARLPAALAVLNLLAGLACGYCLFRRPAGTTFFEVAVLLTGLAAMALALVGGQRPRHALTLATAAAWVILAAATFPWQSTLLGFRDSARAGDQCWAVHQDILRVAGGRKIIVVLPDNSYTNGGVQEFLLKGVSDFPTWYVSERGQRLLEQFAPHMDFRSDGGRTPPGAALPKGSLVVWFGSPDVPPVVDRYPSLGEAVRGAGGDAWAWAYRNPRGQSYFWVKACLVH